MNYRIEDALVDVLRKLEKLIDVGIKTLENRTKENDGQNR